MNFGWTFFRINLLPPQILEINLFIFKILSQTIKDAQLDIGLIIRKDDSQEDTNKIIVVAPMIDGGYHFDIPLMEYDIGPSNILGYILRLNFNQRKKILEYTKIFEALGAVFQLLNTFYLEKWGFSDFFNKIFIKGQHNCILNCGLCCDGDRHTRSPILGGLYCKALTTIGNFCMYYLKGIPLPAENDICHEYYCGVLSDNNNHKEQTCKGCECMNFHPFYSHEKMEEFFTLYESLQKTKDITPILEIQHRSEEINLFQEIYSEYIELKKNNLLDFPELIENFEYKIGNYEWIKAKQVLTENQECFYGSYLQFQTVLENFKNWYHIYSSRKESIQ